MAISPSISVSQSALNPANLTVTDTSTGSYDTITQRRLYVQLANGQYLTGDGTVNYTDWAIGNLSITLAIITGDTGANIRVDWLDVSNVVVNTLNANYPLPQFGKQFFFYLIQLQGLTPGVYQDLGYKGNLAAFWAYLNGGINAVEDGNDIAGAQNCFNITNLMRTNQSYYF